MEPKTLTEQKTETPLRAVSCAVYPSGSEREAAVSLAELSRLLDTADAVCVGTLTQIRAHPDSAGGLGSGKLEELSALCDELEADLVVYDGELSPAQLRTIEDAITREVEVMDRSMLILAIFARHATTAEGRLQVELAQLKYTAPRLMGRGRDLSRLGGGIGTRGPGESKLEIDRRRLKTRVRSLETEIAHLASTRGTMRAARDRSGLLRCAIVGYTNAGKSTLLNTLTNAGIVAQDKLFATLDPTTRQYTLPSGARLLLTDTVGFIRNLPHHLIDAFRSTLEEAAHADAILNVCDASDEEVLSQMEVTAHLLEELGAAGKPVLYIFNKCDAVPERDRLAEMRTAAAASDSDAVFISAGTGEGMDDLTEALERIARGGRRRESYLIPYADGAALHLLHDRAHDLSLEYTDGGVRVSAIVDARVAGRLAAYRLTDEAHDGERKEEEDV